MAEFNLLFHCVICIEKLLVKLLRKYHNHEAQPSRSTREARFMSSPNDRDFKVYMNTFRGRNSV